MNQVLLQESLNALKWKLNQYLTSEEPTKDIGDFYCSLVFLYLYFCTSQQLLKQWLLRSTLF